MSGLWGAAERIRIQNTADTNAYSVVNTQTRDHNMIAITNRAMVANQVAIGQYVGVVSWNHSLHEFAENLDTIGDVIEYFPHEPLARGRSAPWQIQWGRWPARIREFI